MKMWKGKPELKKERKHLKCFSAVLLIAVLILNLCACGSSMSGTDRDTAVEATTEGIAANADSGQAEQVGGVTDDPVGSPWVDSVLSGNLPKTVPEAKDDVYLHYNYETLLAHQGETIAVALDNDTAIVDYISDLMEGKQKAKDQDRDYSDEEMETLRIFYDQASDLDALAKTGISELKPYLDRVEAVTSLEELNEVLASEDFPFNPYFYTAVSAYDMSGRNNVFIYPDFLFGDIFDGAGNYQEPRDENEEIGFKRAISDYSDYVEKDLTWLGLSDEEAKARTKDLVAFEKSYGKDAFYNARCLDLEYGALSSFMHNMSLEDLAGLCPAYPLRECLRKTGRDTSEFYSVMGPEWIKSFNAVWKEENLDILKTRTMVSIIAETRAYLDPAVYDPVREAHGKEAFDARKNAQNACDRSNTFAQLCSGIYVSDQYTDQDIARLTDMSGNLITALSELMDQTSWLSDESRKKCHEKLDKMRLNIMIPDGGYVHFDDLKLTSTEDGGTLIGNYLKVKKYLEEQENARIGKPALSRMIWEYYKPSIANCFYDPDTNSINIFPGFMSSMGYTGDESDEVLYGTHGWVIGHEISHGFDFLGSQLDAYGTGHSIYGDKDLDGFLKRVDRLVAYYDTMEPLPGVKVNGNKVKMEGGADLNGMHIVLKASEEKKDFDYEGLFKTASGLFCMTAESEEIVRYLLGADIHPLMYLRGNINMQMFDEFYDTYHVKEGDGMYLSEKDRIHFWGE